MAARMSRRGNTAKAPQPREPHKEPKKVTLADECRNRLSVLHEQERSRQLDATRARHRAEEDEVMAMMYGPNWRSRTDLPS